MIYLLHLLHLLHLLLLLQQQKKNGDFTYVGLPILVSKGSIAAQPRQLLASGALEDGWHKKRQHWTKKMGVNELHNGDDIW